MISLLWGAGELRAAGTLFKLRCMKSILLAVTLGFMVACGSGQSNQAADSLSQREKDSILANSKIPGARAVGSAMRAADSTNAKVLRVDTVARDTSEH
jgi:hypothetical protein